MKKTEKTIDCLLDIYKSLFCTIVIKELLDITLSLSQKSNFNAYFLSLVYIHEFSQKNPPTFVDGLLLPS
jgi:hypothetical protein